VELKKDRWVQQNATSFKSRLEGHGRGGSQARDTGTRGRVLNEHFHVAAVHLLTKRRAGTLVVCAALASLGPRTSRCLHEHEHRERGDGTSTRCRRIYYPRGSVLEAKPRRGTRSHV
jgi:hypothetical protein